LTWGFIPVGKWAWGIFPVREWSKNFWGIKIVDWLEYSNCGSFHLAILLKVTILVIIHLVKFQMTQYSNVKSREN
jgi:hypothetical protein